VNADGTDRQDPVQPSLLPPVVTRRSTTAGRPAADVGLVPPFKARPVPRPVPPPRVQPETPRVEERPDEALPPVAESPDQPAETIVPATQVEPVEAMPVLEEVAVFAAKHDDAAPALAEPILDLVEFGAAIEELPADERIVLPDAFDAPVSESDPADDGQPPLDLEMPWQDLAVEAVAEPVAPEPEIEEVEFFAGDIALGEPEDAQIAAEAATPFEAFLLTPEVELIPAAPASEPEPLADLEQVLAILPPHMQLADRFERLSLRLRAEPLDTLLPSLAQGDHFDALMAGFLAGYVAAKKS
jgi:hypothetical protein